MNSFSKIVKFTVKSQNPSCQPKSLAWMKVRCQKMSNEEQFKKPQPRRRGPMGRGMQPGEKPKNLKSH